MHNILVQDQKPTSVDLCPQTYNQSSRSISNLECNYTQIQNIVSSGCNGLRNFTLFYMDELGKLNMSIFLSYFWVYLGKYFKAVLNLCFLVKEIRIVKNNLNFWVWRFQY